MTEIKEETLREESKYGDIAAYTFDKTEKLPKSKGIKFQAHDPEGNCLAFTQCGTMLITAGGTTIKSWKEDYKQEFTLQQSATGLPKAVNILSISSNQRFLAVANLDFNVRLLSLQSIKVN
jgi:WD40 repeat protein